MRKEARSVKLFQEDVPFYRGNFHTHTTQSDGCKTPQEAMSAYREAGYDFLALTDHRRVTGVEQAPEGLVAIPGIELDYALSNQWVHLLGLGVSPEVERRCMPRGSVQEGIDLIRACGGLAVLNHPAWSLNTPELIASLRGLTAAEVWNSVSTLPYNADRADASSLLDVAAAQGAVLPLMANDDTHYYEQDFARGWNMVQASEKSVAGILTAVAEGRYYATQGPAFRQVEIIGRTVRVSCSPVERIVFYSNVPWTPDRCSIGQGLTEAVYELTDRETFIRVQLTDAQGRNAWCSPVARQWIC